MGLCFFVLVVPSHAADVRLAWNANAEPDIVGYKVYYGTASHVYGWVIDVGKVTNFMVTGLNTGLTYYFAVTAYDTSSLESSYSNEVSTNTCKYSISPISQNFTASGGTGIINVSTQSACSWTASSGVPWVTITGGASGSGNGIVNYSVAANTGSSSRTVGSTIAKNIFTITQAGSDTSSYTITASSGSGGTISPSGNVTVNQGTSRTFTITPNSGYSVSSVTVDGSSVGAVSTYTFNNVTANHTISASFKANPTTYTLTINKGGSGLGTIVNNPAGSNFVSGTTVSLTARPDPGSSFTGWSGGCSGTITTCSVTMNSNVSVAATFSLMNTNQLSINITSPDGGETLPAGSTWAIAWTAPSEAVRFNLFYSINGGLTWKTIIKKFNGNSYQWPVPSLARSKTKCKILVIGYDAKGKRLGSDKSTGTFTIQVVNDSII
jgi:hypothetical protein